MTMSKLANLAGVSVSTISKAFSGSKEISEERRNFIFEIAKQAGCYDKYCKNVHTEKVIAVICPEYKSRFYSEQLSILEKEMFDSDEPRAKILEEVFKTRGMHEFKKVEFAQLVQKNIKSQEDISPEIAEIIEEIRSVTL